MDSVLKVNATYYIKNMEDYFEDPVVQMRAKKRLLKVTYTDGKSVCYNNTTMTFMEVLRRIGIEKLQHIDFKISNIPFISQTLYPKYKEYQKELVAGWYVMTQSDSGQKYRQLLAINELLGLDFKVEIGEDFEPQKIKMFQKQGKSKSNLLVTFPDGEHIASFSSGDTYKEALQKIGLDKIHRKGIEPGGKPLISSSQLLKSYEEVEPGKWLHIPCSNKEKAKILKVVGAYMQLALEVTVI